MAVTADIGLTRIKRRQIATHGIDGKLMSSARSPKPAKNDIFTKNKKAARTTATAKKRQTTLRHHPHHVEHNSASGSNYFNAFNYHTDRIDF
jgi:hypothetical protein